MKLVIEGHEKEYDLQSIASAFFPGQSFNIGLPVIESKVVSFENRVECKTVISGENKRVEKTFSVEKSKEDAVRMSVKGSFYDAAVEYTGIIPPWGEFSGIRPVKYMSALLNNPEEAKKLFCENLGVSKEKAALCERVLNLRENIPLENGIKDFSLYISIPFCPSRCAYCSFISQAGEKMLNIIPEYIETLCFEISQISKIVKENNLILRSIYIGGGTPAVLSKEDLETLLKTVRASFNLLNVKEFTVEAGRPDAITKEKLQVLKNYNVDRISINPQTLNDSVLKTIGRKHTSEQFYEAWELAQNLGFKSINADIIVGLPEDDLESFKNTVNKLISLSPQNITVHSLCLKKSSWLKVEENISFLKNKEAIAMSGYANNILIEKGFEPYYMYKQKNAVGSLENTGFCKNGFASYYNMVMMDDIQSVIGLGAGSTTKLFSVGDPQRIYNCKYPFEYISHKDKLLENIKQINEFYKKY